MNQLLQNGRQMSLILTLRNRLSFATLLLVGEGVRFSNRDSPHYAAIAPELLPAEPLTGNEEPLA